MASEIKTEIEWEKVISSSETMPVDVDLDSSAFYVYIRKDIVPYEEFDDEGNQTFKGWQYLECKVDNSNFVAKKLQEQKETSETIMLGLCDLYEAQLGE